MLRRYFKSPTRWDIRELLILEIRECLGSILHRQMALNAEWPHIVVSKAMCAGCQNWFRSLAQYQRRDWYVTDPNGTWIFRTDGSVVTSSGLQVPTGQPITGTH